VYNTSKDIFRQCIFSKKIGGNIPAKKIGGSICKKGKKARKNWRVL
jgi:hypothetical protein